MRYLFSLLLLVPLAASADPGADNTPASGAAASPDSAPAAGKKPAKDRRSASRRRVEEETNAWLEEIEEQRRQRESKAR